MLSSKVTADGSVLALKEKISVQQKKEIVRTIFGLVLSGIFTIVKVIKNSKILDQKYNLINKSLNIMFCPRFGALSN